MGNTDSLPENMGWRVLEVLPDGPCSHANMVPYFEFIVGINGVRLDTSSETFWDIIQSHENHSVIMTVFNYKTHIKRNIEVKPNGNWGGQGLLGLVVVNADFTKADEQAVRVLKVHPNSPASKSGLKPQTDFMLGTPIEAFTDFGKFKSTIQEYIETPLPIWVYNSKDAEIRLIEIEPTEDWGGTGILGCEVGDGYLHHIPSLTEKQTEIKVQLWPTNIDIDQNEQTEQSKQSEQIEQQYQRKDSQNISSNQMNFESPHTMAPSIPSQVSQQTSQIQYSQQQHRNNNNNGVMISHVSSKASISSISSQSHSSQSYELVNQPKSSDVISLASTSIPHSIVNENSNNINNINGKHLLSMPLPKRITEETSNIQSGNNSNANTRIRNENEYEYNEYDQYDDYQNINGNDDEYDNINDNVELGDLQRLQDLNLTQVQS